MKKIIIIVALIIVAVGAYLFFQRQNSNNSSVKNSLKDSITSTGSAKGTLVESEFLDTFTVSQIKQSNENFYSRASVPQAQYDVDRYSISFKSTEDHGETLIIKSQLFIPKIKEGEKAPLYVFGQGTTGLGENCAPSKERPEISNWGNYRANILSYAAQGYIVVFPDYEGFNDRNRLHHYFNAKLEAEVLLDAARAAFNFFEKEAVSIEAEQAVFFAGYSQGGHAAFAVKDLASQYAPELPVKGVIGYGATTNMVALLKENPTLAPYVFYSYSDHYGKDVVDPAELLLPSLLPTLDRDAKTTCIGDIYKLYGYDARRIFSPSFYDALYNDKLDQEYPSFKKVLDENSSGYKSSDIPSLILQGTTDPIVTLKSQKEFLSQMCSSNNNLTYIEYPGIHHYQTRQVSFKDSLDWMKRVSGGEIPESYCNKL